MFKSQTVFVIGAGASAEANLPVGDKLTGKIRTLAEALWRGAVVNRVNDFNVATAIQQHAEQHGQDLARYKEAACLIYDAMKLNRSIDEFIYTHNDNKELEQIAKVCIARAILVEERASDLYIDDNKNSDNYYDKLTDKWYIRFF